MCFKKQRPNLLCIYNIDPIVKSENPPKLVLDRFLTLITISIPRCQLSERKKLCTIFKFFFHLDIKHLIKRTLILWQVENQIKLLPLAFLVYVYKTVHFIFQSSDQCFDTSKQCDIHTLCRLNIKTISKSAVLARTAVGFK